VIKYGVAFIQWKFLALLQPNTLYVSMMQCVTKEPQKLRIQEWTNYHNKASAHTTQYKFSLSFGIISDTVHEMFGYNKVSLPWLLKMVRDNKTQRMVCNLSLAVSDWRFAFPGGHCN